ncbi:DUF2244 domain-containing protein [Pseudoruegeria sp. SK021]|uniref:DUF2244 domain-containing protein n=1 Tax=Pseudoruegeria sp. SK021 TaxID=1933035 RepID=UPI000A25A7B3|nr:DUF2244 domain-containing protein [Pseudoruegeria sp. SK021]OSP56660.1 hypothetical protein BV911_01515 [Pseudoruegeria sp. SK021]
MPVEWMDGTSAASATGRTAYHAAGDPPLIRLHLWPYRSLPRRGFVLVIGATFALLMIPLLSVIGTPVLWGLLPFLLGALALLWFLLEKSYRDGEILEELRLWTDRADLTHQPRRGPTQSWAANPYWVSVQLHPSSRPVEQYLTLRGAGREVELGAFLSADERVVLFDQLEQVLAALRTAGAKA